MAGEGLLSGISKQLEPHAKQLNMTIASTGILLHHKLEQIEKHLGDLSKPDVGDKFFRIRITGTQKAERTVLATVPVNEIWPVRYIATAGGREKTPAFTVELNRVVVFAFNKEGTGAESPGGDLIALEGEQLELNPGEEGKFEVTIIINRVRLPVSQIPANEGSGNGKGKLIGRNTHDPARDLIGSATGIYNPAPNELLPRGTDEFGVDETG